ncbi:hypothetical protein JB92DRAFT_3030835 [Gautieria morchelliformis]|nr:hypothetical protein JB92DRAFT_3030835 [Gautieria morchelliformis]
MAYGENSGIPTGTGPELDIFTGQATPLQWHTSQREVSKRNDLRQHRDHAYIRTADTRIRSPYEHVCQIDSPCHDSRYFVCAYEGCMHPVGFYTAQEAADHVRAMHVPDKPFTCMTCGASFMRKQDAVRHVKTMNSGKMYKCRVCKEAYSRKDYCLVHEKRCLGNGNSAASSS